VSGSLTSILQTKCVFLDLKAKKRKQAIEELAEHAAACLGIADARGLAKELWKREKLSTTAVGHGVAIPHRLTDLVSDTVMIFGRSEHGVPFEAVDNEPVRILVMILGPEGAHSKHLQLLSRLARLMSSTEFRQELLDAGSPDEVIEVFARRESGK
jgi:fructose-specific phosphotransferase system IIA component